jgi:predicted RNase H-like HicB family nuclease
MALFSKERPVAQSIRTVGDRPNDIAIFGTWTSGERHFSIAGIHPDKPDEEWKTVNRSIYLARIAQWVEERAKNNEAVAVIGDFNATPWSASMRAFSQGTGLRNANDGKIFAATWNVWQPQRLLIDHAFFSQDWRLRECRIGPAIGSDHRPLIVQATLRESAQAAELPRGRSRGLVPPAALGHARPVKLPPLTSVVEREDDWFVANCPELGVTSQGRTIEEAESMLQEAVELWLEVASEQEVEQRLSRGVKVSRLELAHAEAAGLIRC